MKWLSLIVVGLIFLFSEKDVSAQTIDELDKKYYALGVPIANKSWTRDEYKNAALLIKDAMKSDTISPLTSESPILRKFLDAGSSYLFSDSFFSLNDKVLNLANVMEANGQVLVAYFGTDFDDKEVLVYSNEFIGLYMSNLDLFIKAMSIMNNFLDANPNLTAQQLEGVARMKNGLNTSISAALLTLEKEYIYFQKADICTFGVKFNDFYKIIEVDLDKDARNEFSKQLTSIKKTHAYDCLRNL